METTLSDHKSELAKAIGKTLTEITRWFVIDLETFTTEFSYEPEQYIQYNTGLTSFQFGNDVKHTYFVNGEQLSLDLLEDSAADDGFSKQYLLSDFDPVQQSLKKFLGKTCIDVRIWKCKEALVGGEIGDAGISYRFEDGSELFYCIYIHGELDGDFLLEKDKVIPSEISSGYSLKEAKEISFEA